jgi:hypothetical protein
MSGAKRGADAIEEPWLRRTRRVGFADATGAGEGG